MAVFSELSIYKSGRSKRRCGGLLGLPISGKPKPGKTDQHHRPGRGLGNTRADSYACGIERKVKTSATFVAIRIEQRQIIRSRSQNRGRDGCGAHTVNAALLRDDRIAQRKECVIVCPDSKVGTLRTPRKMAA